MFRLPVPPRSRDYQYHLRMHIVDSQIHVWEHDHPEALGRHGDRPMRTEDVLAEMRAAGVARAILIPPYWVGNDNSLALRAAMRHPDRFAVMGRIDLAVPDEAALHGWREQPGMRGVRLLFNTPESLPQLEGAAADWFWRCAEDIALPVMLHAPGRLDAVARLAARFPRLPLAIDHMGIGRAVRDDAAFAHIAQLLALARCDNVCVKMSTVPIFSSEGYPYRNIHPYLRRITDAFGARRVFWGSDLSRLPCSYRLCVDLFLEELHWLSQQEREWIMGRALAEWAGWRLAPDAWPGTPA